MPGTNLSANEKTFLFHTVEQEYIKNDADTLMPLRKTATAKNHLIHLHTFWIFYVRAKKQTSSNHY